MSFETDQKTEQKSKLSLRRSHRRPRRVGSATGVSVPVHAGSRVPQRSQTTGLIFQAILGAAACLALVGVVAQSRSAEPSITINPGSPDAPPPAVFVQTD